MKHPELTQCPYSLYSSWELSATLILIQGLSRLRLCGWWEMRLQWKGNKTWDKLREKARDHWFHNLPWNWLQEASPSREPHTKGRALVPTLETHSFTLPRHVLPWLVRHLGILRIKWVWNEDFHRLIFPPTKWTEEWRKNQKGWWVKTVLGFLGSEVGGFEEILS